MYIKRRSGRLFTNTEIYAGRAPTFLSFRITQQKWPEQGKNLPHCAVLWLKITENLHCCTLRDYASSMANRSKNLLQWWMLRGAFANWEKGVRKDPPVPQQAAYDDPVSFLIDGHFITEMPGTVRWSCWLLTGLTLLLWCLLSFFCFHRLSAWLPCSSVLRWSLAPVPMSFTTILSYFYISTVFYGSGDWGSAPLL